MFPVKDLMRDDSRFLFFDPTRPEMNYNADWVLTDAVRAGYRGAYWDILRQVADQSRSG
jgi:hypothetical protein